MEKLKVLERDQRLNEELKKRARTVGQVPEITDGYPSRGTHSKKPLLRQECLNCSGDFCGVLRCRQ